MTVRKFPVREKDPVDTTVQECLHEAARLSETHDFKSMIIILTGQDEDEDTLRIGWVRCGEEFKNNLATSSILALVSQEMLGSIIQQYTEN